MTSDFQSSRVISVDGIVFSVSVSDNVIYALVDEFTGEWLVRVYGSDYQLIRSWRHEAKTAGEMFCQLEVRKDCVLVPHIVGKTIIQYSLTGEVERRIPCPILMDASTWLCVMSPHCDTVIVSSADTVSCIDLSTGRCVWSTDTLDYPTAVACHDADRVYVAVGGLSENTQIAVLDGDTGKTVTTSQTHQCF